jgi:integrase
MQDITKVLDAISGRPSEARHAYIAIRAFFSWCCARQHLARSPCESLPAPARARSRERVLNDAELSSIYNCAGEIGQFGTIVRLCIVTAQRRGEIGALKWSYIEPGQRLILFPGSAVKNGKAHTLPLTPLARSLLPHHNCSPYLFPGRDEIARPYQNWSKDVERLKRAVEFRDWCLHDLRRSAASGMARIGCHPHVIERILNHSPQGVMAVYQRHRFLDEMQLALESWSRHIQRITGIQVS